MQIRVSMKFIGFLLVIFFFFLYGCGFDSSNEENSGVASDENSLVDKLEESSVIPRFQSKDRKEEQIMKDFQKPIHSYPSIGQEEVEMLHGGTLFRKGIDRPYTGRILEKYEDGSVALESSYLDGLPHGQQLRRFPNGNVALEAIFDNGVLSGIKTKWWESGIVREEEYWSDGKFFGRRLWDEAGRLLKEELVPPE